MRLTLAIVAVAVISGCGTFGRDFPVIDQYRAAVLARQHPGEITDALVTRMRERNQIINDALLIVDAEFLTWVAELHEENAALDTALDIAVIGASTAATLATGEMAKTVLSAVTTAIAGSRLAFSRNFFLDANRYALIARMRASRAAVLRRIEEGKRKSVRSYPVSQAAIDLVTYVYAGTLVNAVQAIAEQSTDALKVERADLERVRGEPIPEGDE